MSNTISTAVQSNATYAHIPSIRSEANLIPEGPQEPASRPSIHPQASGQHNRWRPWSLRPFTLIVFAVLCCAYIAAFQFALFTAQRQGGGIFGVPSWIFKQVPTTGIVLLGMLFSAIQNDVARLEPYYQLSKPGGATAQDGMLVDYQRVFLLWVPVVAFRRRHWTVILATCTLVAVSFGATPLSAMVFTNKELTISETFPAMKMAELWPVEMQADRLSAVFSYNTYEHVWNDQDPPPFVTDEYSIRPFESLPDDSTSKGQGINTIWTFPTTRYSASLDCVVPTQEVTYNSTTKKRLERLFLNYNDGESSCEYPLFSNISSLVTWNLDKTILNRYPHNAIFQDITARQENYRDMFNELSGTFMGNTTKICGLQGEFDFLTFWKNWPIAEEEIKANVSLSPERILKVLRNPIEGDDEDLREYTWLPTPPPNLIPLPGTFTAVLCKAVYKQQPVVAEVDDKFRVLNITKVTGEVAPLRNINTTLFSEILTARHRNFTIALDLAANTYPDIPVGSKVIKPGSPTPNSNITLADGSIRQIYERLPWERNSIFTRFGMPDHSIQMRSSERFQKHVSEATTLLNQDKNLLLNTLITPLQSLLPFALAGADVLDLQELKDSQKLIAALNSSFAMLFSYSMSSGNYFRIDGDQRPETDAGGKLVRRDSVDITRRTLFLATEVSLLYARLTQAALGLAAVLALGLIFRLARRPLHTVEEPGAIIWHMKSLANCKELAQELDGVELLAPAELDRKFKGMGGRYYLNPAHGGIETMVTERRAEGSRSSRMEAESLPHRMSSTPRTSAPLELNLYMAFAVVFGLVTTCATLGVAYYIDKSKLGFFLQSDIVAKIVLSYLPTAFGMLVEAFILMVTKFVGLIIPYDDMHCTRTSDIATLEMNYESAPPSFLWFKALRNGHVMLAALSFSGILANVLAVSFAGLFEQQTVYHNRTELVNSAFSAAPKMNLTNLEAYVHMPRWSQEPNISTFENLWRNGFAGSPDDGSNNTAGEPRISLDDVLRPYFMRPEDSMELVYASYLNITAQGPLRPWTTPTTSFFPLQLENLSSSSTLNIRGTQPLRSDAIIYATTLGLTNKLSCVAIPNSEVITGIDDYLSVMDMDFPMWFVIPGRNPVEPCSGALRMHDVGWSDTVQETEYSYFDTIIPTLRHACLGNFMKTWFRRKGNAKTPGSDQEELIISCSPNLQLQYFAISIDRKGNILSSALAPNQKDTNISTLAPPNELRMLQTFFQYYIGHAGSTQWFDKVEQPDGKPTLWFTRFLHNRYPQLGDSYPPDPAVAIKALHEVYQELFASFLSIFGHVLLDRSPETLRVTISESEAPWRVSFPLFILSEVLMVLFLVVVVAVMVRRPGRFLAHLPTSIASTMATIYAGKWITDMSRAGNRGTEADDDVLEVSSLRFGYGWFVGADGHWHLGIDKEPVERLTARNRRGVIGEELTTL